MINGENSMLISLFTSLREIRENFVFFGYAEPSLNNFRVPVIKSNLLAKSGLNLLAISL